MTISPQHLRITGLLSLFLVVACASWSEPGSDSTASVTASQAATPEMIFAAAERVFAEAGFNLHASPPDARLFERAGTRMDALR